MLFFKGVELWIIQLVRILHIYCMQNKYYFKLKATTRLMKTKHSTSFTILRKIYYLKHTHTSEANRRKQMRKKTLLRLSNAETIWRRNYFKTF